MLDHLVTHNDVPTFLEAIKRAQQFSKGATDTLAKKISINIVTNYTDDVLVKSLTGLCVAASIEPTIYTVPYKQYLFALKDHTSRLFADESAITFFSFELSAYKDNELLTDPNLIHEVIADITNFTNHTQGVVVINTILSPADVQHQRLFKNDTLAQAIDAFNAAIRQLAAASAKMHVLETDSIALFTPAVYDQRGLFAFDRPFTNEFMYRISIEWFAYVKSILGITKKCLVLDLDNTLWGGVVGECGPLGIALGPEYPGNAFVAFQKTLLQYYEQGVILAINSRNNITDVEEVFKKNRFMLLKEEHFACIVANWNTKSKNLRIIAQELNIGLDSLVFIDDDAMNRDLVRAELPEVLVPDFSLPPELYSEAILNLNAFHTLALTEEDKNRGKMYAAERKRKEYQTTARSPEEYLKTLEIAIEVHKNNPDHIPRVAQLTQKTNQFNLTTKRYTEGDIERIIKNGGYVYSGNVVDKFGDYGITILMIFTPKDTSSMELDTALMSCRVMGRNVEHDFFKAVVKDLSSQNISLVYASYIPTPKNQPVADYLPEIGGEKQSDDSYLIDLAKVDAESILSQVSFVS